MSEIRRREKNGAMTSASRIIFGTAPLVAAVLLAACACAPPAPAPQSDSPPPATSPEPAPASEAESKPAPKLKRHHPIRYVVKKGDTLWDISSRFLKSPWLWPDIWYVNPQIRNPHLIYPGDVIELRWVHGRPQLTLAGTANEHGLPVKHLHPKVHSTPIKEAIPTIPIAAIRPFLVRAPVVTDDEMEKAPYIVATGDGRVIAGQNRDVYARGVKKGADSKWMLVRKGDALRDPKSGDLLGYQGIFLGTGKVTAAGDPATMTLSKIKRGVKPGDRLFAYNDATLPVNFYPHPPEQSVDGQIISVLEGVSQVGQYDVVVLDRGDNAGLKPGAVLAIYQRGRVVEDPYKGDDVTLPDRRAGLLMVFRTFDKVSYGLVMQVHNEVHVLDLVRNPK
jgi:hypothetical protein